MFGDTLNQQIHVHALKAMKCDCFNTFITAAAELRLNQSVTCKWQKFSQDCESVPLYSELLKLLDLEARGAENMMGESGRVDVQLLRLVRKLSLTQDPLHGHFGRHLHGM